MKLSELKSTGLIRCLVYGDSGAGKCLGKGTKILCHDGSFKPVEEVKVGDKLMGPDSKPRIVLSLCGGTDTMYKIIPVKGEPWTCNSEHILTVYKHKTKELVDMHINDILIKYGKNPVGLCLARTGVNFNGKIWDSKLSPYELGIWLGDGHMRAPAITKNDVEIQEAWKNLAVRFGLFYKKEIDTRSKCITGYAISKCPVCENLCLRDSRNPLLKELDQFKHDGYKKIPLWALTSSRENRLDLLAGMIDTDGSAYHGCFEWSTKKESLCDEFIFLARSLGFAAYKSKKIVNGRDYWRVQVSGDLSIVPTRIKRKRASIRRQIKSVLHTGFEIKKLGSDIYFGFMLDGDGRFLLHDFTITHNSCLAASYPKPMLYLDFDGKVNSAARFYAGQPWLNDIEVIDCRDLRDSSGQLKSGIPEMDKALRNIEKNPDNYKTIVLDSVTMFSAAYLNYVVKSNTTVKRVRYSGGEQPCPTDYGIFAREVQRVITGILTLPINFVALGHIETSKDELTGELVRNVMIDGQKTAPRLPIWFDEVWRIHARDGKHFLQTKPDYKFTFIRTQIPKIPAELNIGSNAYEAIAQYL